MIDSFEREFEPGEALRALTERGVRIVVIGGIAAGLHGSPMQTGDLDIVPGPGAANLAALSEALTELRARIRAPDAPDGLPFAHDAESLAQAQIWNLVTRYGDLDILLAPDGAPLYDELERQGVEVEIDGVPVIIASVEHLIAMKRAAGREKDRLGLPYLERLLREGQGE